MSFHFYSHAWEVRDMEDGTRVRLSARDLDPESISVLVEDLFELAQESGQPHLYLDFAEIRQVASVVMGKLLALHARLREHGGRVILQSLNPLPYETLQAARLTEILEVHMKEASETIF